MYKKKSIKMQNQTHPYYRHHRAFVGAAMDQLLILGQHYFPNVSIHKHRLVAEPVHAANDAVVAAHAVDVAVGAAGVDQHADGLVDILRQRSYWMAVVVVVVVVAVDDHSTEQ